MPRGIHRGSVARKLETEKEIHGEDNLKTQDSGSESDKFEGTQEMVDGTNDDEVGVTPGLKKFFFSTEIRESSRTEGNGRKTVNIEQAPEIHMDMRPFRDVSEILSKFDPVRDEYRVLYAWDEITTEHYALAKLDGVARKWRDSLPRVDDRSWAQRTELLESSFPCEEDPTSLRMAAQNYRRRANQDIVEYYYEQLSRCLKAEIQDKEIIQWMADGLNNSRFRDYL